MEKHEDFYLKDRKVIDLNNQNPESEFYFIENLKSDWGSSPSETYTLKNLRIKKSLFIDNNEIHIQRGQKVNRIGYSTLSGSVYSVAVQDYIVGITNLSYAASVGLPRPKDVGNGKVYIVKDEAGGATTTTITVRSVGEENIDGASTSTITSNYASKEYYTDGAVWFTK